MLPVVFILMVLTVFSIWGCSPKNTVVPNYNEFIMQIDSIQHPSSVFLGSNLPIKFYGMIGPNGCYTFSRFSPSLKNKTINITVYGKQEESTSCGTTTSYLNGGTLTVTHLDTGRYVIHVSQPAPPDIYDTVHVRLRSPVK